MTSLYKWPSDKKLILYYTNWSVYARNFQVKDIPIDHVTDINYAFYDLRPNQKGNFIPTTGDAWADTDQRYTTAEKGTEPLDTWNDDNMGIYGNFGQFKKLKDAGKKFNLGLSVGGWSWSGNFSPSVSTADARRDFVNEIIAIFKKYPFFNRVDFDWEYISPDNKSYGLPGNKTSPDDSKNFAELLKLMRSSLNENGMKNYEISACTTADPVKMQALPIKEMVMYLDTINIMTYDFADGAWGAGKTTHSTNTYKTDYTPFSVDTAVKEFVRLGVPKNKIVIGVAYYSRGFSACGGLNKDYVGGSSDKSWEQGIVDYKSLPLPGAIEFYDEKAGAGYSYDADKKILNSYDTVASVKEKCSYVKKNGLKGIIVWEASGDHPISSDRCLTKAIYNELRNIPPNIPLPPTPVVTPPAKPPTPVVTVPLVNVPDINSKCPYLAGKIKSISISGDVELSNINFNY